MALTRLDLVGDGTSTIVDVTFGLGYLRREFVFVHLSTNDPTTQLDYIWVNSTQIELTTPVANGVEYNVRRIVPRDELVNDYTDGAIIREQNLDSSYLQALMILEEMSDGYSTGAVDADLLANLNMNDFKIINLGDGVDPQDAVNMRTASVLFDQKLENFDPDANLNYGLITEVVGDADDYGGLT